MKISAIELEKLLDEIPVALTYVDTNGIILYRNKTAAQRPLPKGTREPGANIRDCHALPESLEQIEKIFNGFKNGRKTPHHYISQRTDLKELVTLTPMFEKDQFVGCFSTIHPLEIKGVSRTF
ncbi:PAS domain-containing protein [Candidatus Borrarchaeum sp.]|uniref:PAS domain-containing protein n=1 Tax=Candidatus Borrarchaeum sp. TaxID=2846742 RepID=UPI00257AA866|nr:PAS domain-containing protein [Candidatus Borrarchaeum sp.]